ncbi:MAG TPA: hypothetical protein VMI56_24540 [Reyranella sp.]|nr:hypothetical protein [Reyranella sp.]
MSLRWTLVLVLLTAVAACSGSLPNSAISRHLAARYTTEVDTSTPIATVIRDRGIHPPDAAASTPLLEQLRAELAKSDVDGAFAGITYDLTQGNRLGPDWIVQSPDQWGRRASELPPGHSDHLLVRVHDLVASARQRVDITALQPPPDTLFLRALHDALESLSRGPRPVTVRVLIGQYPPQGADAAAFLKALTDGIVGPNLSVSVAAMRSCEAFDDCDSFSWNHSKIISVDGRAAMVGGHNLWSSDYLLDNPVHDLSMELSGPAAASAAHFADKLWDYVCAHADKAPAIAVVSWNAGREVGGCIAPPALSPAKPAKEGVPILGVGRLAAGITKDFTDQSGLARDLMLASAHHSIRIVQQDLGFGLFRADTLFPDSTIDRLVDFLRRKEGDIYIVLSNYDAVGNSGSIYSNGVTLAQLALHLRDAVQERIYRRDPLKRYEGRGGPDPTNALLCSRVHLAPLRFGPDSEWPSGRPFANHAKFWMIDERAFYIGSDNMYPVNLQEYGYIVADHKAAQELTDAYWTPLWEWSKRAAVSGPEVKDCIFREVPNH